MKGRSACVHSEQSDGVTRDYPTTFSIDEPYKIEYVDRPKYGKSTRRVEVPQFRPSKMALNSEWIDADDDVAPTSKQWDGILLSDAESVKVALEKRLTLLQQQALKRIAKAWIKALCPKKQARYPYRSKQKRGDSGIEPDIPEWWNVELCAHIEPDHVDKTARTNLCLHILRLRPTTEQLKKWNGDLYVPNKTLETQGWTAFLQEQTQFSTMLIGLGKSPEPQGKLELRQKILDDLYYIAGEEERFLADERDGDIIQVHKYDDAVTVANKQPYAKKRGTDDGGSKSADTVNKRRKKNQHDATHEDAISRVGLVEINRHIRHGPVQVGTALDDVVARAVEPEPKPNRTKKSHRGLQAGPHLPMVHPFGLIPEAFPLWRPAGYSTSSEASSPNTLIGSFDSSHSEYDAMSGPPQIQGAPSNLPGGPGLSFEELEHHQQMMHVYNVTDLSHPQFSTVPNTPIISPIPVKFERGPEVAICPEEHQVVPAMESYPGHVPPQQHLEFTAPSPAASHAMVPTNDPYGHRPFSKPDQLRPMTHAPQVPSAFNGFQMAGLGDVQHHGLPVPYHQDFLKPEENGDQVPFVYPGPILEPDFPPAALPASVIRGFTGNSSGVGGGAMT